MGKLLFIVGSEWDIGEKNVVFRDKKAAMDWLEQNQCLKEVLDESQSTVEEYIEEGYISFRTVMFVG